MKRLAALYNGALPEFRTFTTPRYARWLSELVYLLDLAGTDLRTFDGLLVPEGSHHAELQAAAVRVHDLLERGGTVVVLGDQPASWLPGLAWEFRSVSQSGPLVAQHPGDAFHRRIDLRSSTWHHHGVFRPPPDAQTLLATEDGAAVLYVDRSSTAGTMVVASLDPIAHYGAQLLAPAGSFLDGFLTWIVEDVL